MIPTNQSFTLLIIHNKGFGWRSSAEDNLLICIAYDVKNINCNLVLLLGG